MARIIDEDYETKSEQEINNQRLDREDDIRIIFRNNSLPLIQYHAERKLVEKYILVRMDEMGFEVNRADYILQNIDDENFPLDNENLILQRVIQTYFVLETYNQDQSRYQQTQVLNEITGIVGKVSPNFLSYFGKKRDSISLRQSQLDLKLNQQQYQCQICFDDIKDNNISIKLECEHTFCYNCMKEYLENKIITGQVEKIICPQDGCHIQLDDNYISQMVDESNMNKLKKFRKIKQQQLDPNIIWCPRPGCEEVLKKNESKKLQCKCGQQICKKCYREKHKGQTCSEQLDKNFKKAIKKLKIQNCKKCKSPIQKNDGCNHMTCKQCKYEFCWLCRAKYSYRHYSSYNIFGCPGMQFTHRDPFKFPNLYRFIAIILLLILGPPLLVIGLILGFIVVVIGLPAIVYMNYVPGYVFSEYGCCHQFCIIITLIIICPVVSPISLLLVLLGIAATIIIGIPYSIYCLIDWLRYR